MNWKCKAFAHVLLVLHLLLFPVLIEGAKIFFLIPLTSKSEKEPLIPFIDALAQRGHDVTVASVTKTKYQSKNIREFTPVTYEEFMGEAIANPIETRKNMGKYFSLSWEYDMVYPFCHKVFQNQEFQEVIQEKFDVVIHNAIFQDCFLGVLHKIAAPFILFSCMLPMANFLEVTGSSLPTSFVPLAFGPPRPLGKWGLYDRLENFVLDTHYTWKAKNKFIPDGEEVYRHYLGQNVPGGSEIMKNVSMIFSNSHFTFSTPIPALPDVVEIGGMHCRPAKKLPKDLDDFLSGGKDGFIYFSMGSILKSKYFSEEFRDIFLSVFAKLKQRVLWKFEDDAIANLPPNVKISKWLPQQDVLGHPNIKMFITHGGAMSTFEAIYHGVPMVSLPIFCDQDINVKLAADREYTIDLEILDLTAEDLTKAIQKILNEPKYTANAKELSSVFRDQPQTPVERAVFWTEYVIRHKGTKHMRSASRDLHFTEYYYLDAIALVSGILITILMVLVTMCRRLTRSLGAGPSKGTSKKSSKKCNKRVLR